MANVMIEDSIQTHVNDPGRLAALSAVALLDTPTEEAFDRLSRLAACFTNSPVALVSLVDSNRQFFKSCIGLPEPWNRNRETPLSHSFCQHNRVAGKPLVIPDARENPLFKDNLAVRDLNVIAYLGIPLVTSDLYVLGSFCVIDSKPRSWTNKEIETVRDLAAAVMTEIELRTEINRRQQAEKELLESEEKFRVLFESSKDSNYISTIEGNIVEANRSFLSLFGHEREDLPNLRVQDIYINPNHRSEFIIEVEKYGFVKDFEVTMRNKNGNEIDCQITSTVRHSGDGTIIGYQGTIRDVTEIKRRQIEREKLIAELQNALAEVKTLSGLLPICSHCKKIRDDKGYWNQIEGYIQEHSDAKFSHGICRECATKHYPDLDIYDD